ncbi:TPA: hypothetical protein N0F65_009042, partial [Lagenidium giganteum]
GADITDALWWWWRWQETRQAAEYGLSLLEANDELQLQVSALKIQLESEAAELVAERDAYARRHERAMAEAESWKRKYTQLEEDTYDMRDRVESVLKECRWEDDRNSEVIRTLEARVAELEASLARAELTDAHVSRMGARRASQVELRQQQQLAECEAARQSDRSYVARLEAESTRWQTLVEHLKGDVARLQALASENATAMETQTTTIQTLETHLDDWRRECAATAELLQSAQSKCTRLQRELALLEHVSYFSLAVIDRDTDDDSDGESQDDGQPQSKTDAIFEKALEQEGTPSASSPTAFGRSISQTQSPSPYAPFPRTIRTTSGGRVAVTPSTIATHEKLHHYFHLAALSIIHENDLHEQCFHSSSRATIDTWYREVVAKDVPFLDWHSWLTKRINDTVRAEDGDSDSPSGSGSSSEWTWAPRNSFADTLRLLSRRRLSTPSPPATDKGRTHPSGIPRPKAWSTLTARASANNSPPASFSMARSFFGLLGKKLSDELSPTPGPSARSDALDAAPTA